MYFRTWCSRATCVVLLATAGPAMAAVHIDPTGDFLGTYIGPRGGDLDVTSTNATRNYHSVTLVGTHAAAIGTTKGAAYVWGINRGSGFEPFPHFDPPTGKGILFDAYAILSNDGTGTLTDLINHTVVTLDPSSISIAGSTISVTLDSAMLPTTGFAFNKYLYNLWPRFAPVGVDPGSNTQISDFAPDATSFTASVPEPTLWATLIMGFSMTGIMARRRGTAVAA